MASVAGRRARVTFDYEPEQPDELRLTVGDTIDEVEDEDEGWCKGRLNGKVGLFPNNFVEYLPEPAEVVAPAIKEDSKPSKDKLAGKKAKVGFDYDAENSDELTIKVGDVVELIREAEDGWWEGTVHGRTGVFPSNFVELIDESDSPPPLPEKEPATSEPAQELAFRASQLVDEEDTSNKRSSIFGQTKMMGGGMGFGNLISADVLSGTRLKKVDSKKKPDPPEQKAPAPEPSSIKKGNSLKRRAPSIPPSPASTSAPAKKSVGKAKVLFDYTPENEDELALNVGDIVTILNKEVYDTDGWWEGELNGKVGLFPDNFVELLPDEVQPKESPKPKRVPPAPVQGQQDKRTPPPVPSEEEKRPPQPPQPIEAPKKDMKKSAEPKKLPQPKDNEIETPKPHLPPKKPVPPKPSSKPSVLSKKPVPKPPAKPQLQKPASKETDIKNELMNRLNKTAPGIMESPAKPANTSEEFNLDAVKKHEMLDHLTKNRPRLQNQRPPSTTRVSQEGNLFDFSTREEPEGEKEEKNNKLEPTEPAWKREARELREAKESKEKAVPPIPPSKEKKPLTFDKREEPKASSTHPRKSAEPSTKSTDASADEVSSLRKEVAESKKIVEEMKAAMNAMKLKHEDDLKQLEKRLLNKFDDDLKKLEKRLTSDIEQLTEDFDEQRNKYAKLEIDFDRLKKRRRRESVDIDE